MPHGRKTLLCRYHYDPLDRLVDLALPTQAATQRFYLDDRVVTEIQGSALCSIMQRLGEPRTGPTRSGWLMGLCRSELAREKRVIATGYQSASVIVYDHREQARSYS